MKRITAVLIVVSVLFSFAAAENLIGFQVRYNIAATVLKAPKIDTYTESNGLYIYQISNTLGIMVQPNDSGEVNAVSVYCNSDAEFADFLFMSLSILSAYNQISATTEAAIITHLLNLRMGMENTVLPTKDLGGILIRSTEKFKYAFMYIFPE